MPAIQNAGTRAAREMRRGIGDPKQAVRVQWILQVYLAETPIPGARELAGRLGVSVDTIYRDFGSPRFLEGLDQALQGALTQMVQECVGLHAAVMRDPAASRAERMSAARWIHGRWLACRKAVAVGHDKPEDAAEVDEAELLAAVLRETEGRAGAEPRE